jgi:hypothetical protein
LVSRQTDIFFEAEDASVAEVGAVKVIKQNEEEGLR